MWDTAYGEWNAAKMGPKRDIVGELGEAVRERGWSTTYGDAKPPWRT